MVLALTAITGPLFQYVFDTAYAGGFGFFKTTCKQIFLCDFLAKIISGRGLEMVVPTEQPMEMQSGDSAQCKYPYQIMMPAEYPNVC